MKRYSKADRNAPVNMFVEKVNTRNSRTANGAVSHSTSGNVFLDYFTKCGTYRERELQEVFADVSVMFAHSPELTLKMLLYLRLISRQTKGFHTSSRVQKGMGNKDEFYKGIFWLAKYQKEFLDQYLYMIPLVGTWKDLWYFGLIDELNTAEVYQTIKRGLSDPYNRELLAKYLPRLRSRSNCHNERHIALHQFALGLCKFLKWTPVEYRRFKSSGKAHNFQRDMCQGNVEQLDFNSIPGRAMFNLTTLRGLNDGLTYLERHGLEQKCMDWVSSREVVKFTGYVHDLMKAVSPEMSKLQKFIVDRQFNQLISLGKEEGLTENVWCALDTSGSMMAQVAGNVSAFDICISLGIYFSTLNEGAFKDHVMMFDEVSKVKQLHGTSFSDKVLQITSSETAWGSTNFQSLIDEIVRVRIENPAIPLADYPQTLLVISDMQFNPAGNNQQTNYEVVMEKLNRAGLNPIRVIWWFVNGDGKDFPSQINDKGVTLIGGFDGSIVTSLVKREKELPAIHQTNGEQHPDYDLPGPFEQMIRVLNQEILKKVC